jgi:hypothetical protein
MTAYGLNIFSSNEKKHKVCIKCNRNKSFISEKFKFKQYDINNFITIEQEKEINQIMVDLEPENYNNVIVRGIPVGNISQYELILWYKQYDGYKNDEHEKNHRQNIIYTIKTIFAADQIFDCFNPDAVITYNNLYSVNNAFSACATKRNILIYNMEAGLNIAHRLNTLLVYSRDLGNYITKQKKVWSIFKNIPCNKNVAKLVGDHFNELLKGNNWFVYSSASKGFMNIKEIFNINSKQRIVVAVLSSYDEIIAAENAGCTYPYNSIYKTQEDWIKDLIHYFKERKDLFLVIRVHPREFPNKRESNLSQHALTLKSILANLPTNISVNWPNQNLSIYDLAEEAEVFLNAWSSVGKEMSLLGLPVIFYTDCSTYSTDIGFLAKTKDEYFSMIDIAIEQGWDFEIIRKSFRWQAFELYYNTFDISDSYNYKEISLNQYFRRSINIIFRQILPYWREYYDFLNRSINLKDGLRINRMLCEKLDIPADTINIDIIPRINIDEETDIIKHELRRIIHYKYRHSKIKYPANTLYAKIETYLAK